MTLTKREALAGMAMQGILSNSKFLDAIFEKFADGNERAADVAQQACRAADALTAEIDRTSQLKK